MSNLIQIAKIEYTEKSVTEDEKGIAELLERLVRAVNTKKVHELTSIFSESAKIVVSEYTKKEMDRNECLVYMAQALKHIDNLSYSKATVRVEGAKAIVSGLSRIVFRDGTISITYRYFKCSKEGGEWCFAETGFI